MEINLKNLKRDGHIEVTQTITLPRIEESSIEVSSLEDVNVDVTLTFADPLVLLEGTVSTTVHYICSRCLTVFPEPLKTKIDQTYTTDNRKQEDDIPLIEGQWLEITPDLEESVFLALDDRPICRKDCQGLCPVCGINKNEDTCECDTRVVDPRLAGLKDLLSGTDSE